MNNTTINDLEKKFSSYYPDFKEIEFYDEEKWIKRLTNKKFREIRRRLYFYTNLELLASRITIFDVMSPETFQILLHAKRIAKYYHFEEVTEEILLLAFLSGKKEINELFKKSKLNKKVVYQEFLTKYKLPSQNIFQKIANFITEKIFLEKEPLLDKKFNFSTGCLDLLFKASENTFEKFKTFVITPEILFVTLMEKRIPLLLKTLDSQEKWETLKYILLRQIDTENMLVQGKVKPNQLLYIYLLKSKIPQRTYNLYIGGKRRKILYFAFRALIFSKVLKWDRLKFLEAQTRRSIRINSILRYSSSNTQKKQQQILRRGKKSNISKNETKI